MRDISLNKYKELIFAYTVYASNTYSTFSINLSISTYLECKSIDNAGKINICN